MERADRYVTAGRSRAVDIARGISIFAIIFGHLGIWYVTRIVFTFHVPIFFILTGYFIRHDNIKEFVNKRTKSLIIPYIATSVVIILISCVVAMCTGNGFKPVREWMAAALYGSGDSYDTPFSIFRIGALWFLWATFWGSLFLRICLKWRYTSKIIWVCLLFFIGYYTSHRYFWFPFSIQTGCCAVLYMYIGHLIRAHKDKVVRVWEHIRTLSDIVIFVAWIYFIYSFRSFWLVHCDFGRGFIDIILSLCACYCIMRLSDVINIHFGTIAGWLAFWGRNSLIVLCVHTVEMDIISWSDILDFFLNRGIPYYFGGFITLMIKLLLVMGMTVAVVKVTDYKKNRLSA